jgi:hypothetical protein
MTVEHKKTATRYGFTLTEMAIVLLCVSFVVGAIWMAADKVWENYHLYRALQQANTVIQNIRDHYSACQVLPPDPKCGGTTPPLAAGSDQTAAMDVLAIFPAEMRRNPAAGPGLSAIDHPFNNNVVSGTFHILSLPCAFNPGFPLAPGLRCFRMQFIGLSQSACIKMLMGAPITTAEGIVQIGVNLGGSVVMSNQDIINGISGTTLLPLTIGAALPLCGNAGALGTNDVYWDLKLHN